jgi:quercetin dioxygenase-like cupin family protein
LSSGERVSLVPIKALLVPNTDLEIFPGDVVWFAPDEKHWHGATPTTAMTHIAIQEKKDGKVVDWLEHVTDQQYSR